MNDERIKAFIRESLGERGYIATDIPQQETQTADLLVTAESQAYIFEIKSKLDDPIKVSKERAIFEQGGMAERHETTGRTNVISKVTRKAADQLRNHDSSAFRLLWFHGQGSDAKLQADQCVATLYGISDIGERDTVQNTGMKPCYYFDFSEFFELRDVLDGAVVGFQGRDGVYYTGLYINNFSKNKAELLKSKLAKDFGSGLCNPDQLEQNGDIYIADCDVSRNNKLAIFDYLQTKYNVGGLFNLTVESHEFITQISFKPKP